MSDMQDLNTIETFAQLSRVRLLTSFVPGTEGGKKTVRAVVFLWGQLWGTARSHCSTLTIRLHQPVLALFEMFCVSQRFCCLVYS